MPPTTIPQWSLLLLAALIIGISKTGFPNVGILAIPLVAMVIPARASTGLILPMLLVGDIMAVAFYRRHAVWKYLFKLMPCAAAGIVIGYLLLGWVSPRHHALADQSPSTPAAAVAPTTATADNAPQPIIGDKELKPIIGAVILALLILNWWRSRHLAKSGEIHVPHAWWFPIVMGLLGGIVTMMANAAGPIIVIYLLAMHLPKTAFIGTGAWYFLLLNAFKVPFSWNLGLITPESLYFNARIAPVIILGGFAGLYLVRCVPEKPFTWIMQWLAAIAAVQLLISVWT